MPAMNSYSYWAMIRKLLFIRSVQRMVNSLGRHLFFKQLFDSFSVKLRPVKQKDRFYMLGRYVRGHSSVKTVARLSLGLWQHINLQHFSQGRQEKRQMWQMMQRGIFTLTSKVYPPLLWATSSMTINPQKAPHMQRHHCDLVLKSRRSCDRKKNIKIWGNGNNEEIL